MFKSLVATLVLGAAATVSATPLASAGSTSLLTSSVDNSEIKAGELVTVTAVLTVNDSPVKDATVQLWKRDFDDPTFVPVNSAQTNDAGKASLPALPQSKTHYKWTYGADPEPTGSNRATVRVHTVVTLSLVDTQIGSGQKMVAKGKTTPNKAGATVHLYRRVATGNASRWLTGTVQNDGTFRFAKRVGTTNVYWMYAVVPSASGNLRGESPQVQLIIGA